MFVNWKLPFAAAVGALLLSAGMADAQIVTISSANYSPPMPPMRPDPTAKPEGTYSIPVNPAGNPPYRILVDYGTISTGPYQKYAGSPERTVVLNHDPRGGGPFTWSIGNPDILTNRPAGCHARAPLQRLSQQGQWGDVHIAYAPCGP